MKYLKFAAIIFALIFILYYYFGIYDGRKQQPQINQQIESVSGIGQKQWETKTNEEPPVTIKITPIEIGENAEMWRFGVVFDTHSGSLDDDLMKIAVLADDKGKSYRPVDWKGSVPGGHHREGVLVFNAINPVPLYAELKIKNVGGISERSFKWNIKQHE